MTLREKLEKRDGDAERWSPQVDDVLIGKVKAIRSVTTRFGDGKVVDIESEEGVFTVFLTAVLKTEFLAHDVTEGTRVGIKYLGMEEGKGGRNYKRYVVVTGDESENEQKTTSTDDEENKET